MRPRLTVLLTFFLISSLSPAQTKATPPAHPQGGYVTVHGARLWYESEGQGPALVLVAGGPGSSHEYFHPYFSPLAAHYRVVYFDAFGRGKSDKAAKPTEYSFARDVDDLEGLRTALNLGRISVFGHSYGGAVAQAYALKYPTSTRSIILANTFISFEATQEAAAVRERFVQDFFPELWDRIEPLKKQPPSAARDERIDALMDSVPAPISYDYDPAKSDEFDSKHAAFNIDVLKAIWPAGVRTLDFRKSLALVKCPILVLAGRVDHIAPPRLTRQFRVYAPQAEFVMFEKSGHDTFLEEPAKLIQVLAPFLAKQ